jgi:hypothetical protein
MLFLQIALDLIWLHCVLALLIYSYLVLCYIVEMLTCYAYLNYANTLRL